MEYNFFTKKHFEFEKDYYERCSYDLPLPLVIGDITKMMDITKEPYFRIPRKFSKDGREHTFYFTIEKGEYVYSHFE